MGEEALAIAEQRYGPEHSVVATTLTGLSMAYAHLEKYDKAEAIARRCLAVNVAIRARPNDLARAHNNLGMVFKDQEKYVEAREQLERARALWKEVGDTDDLAAVLNNLGQLDQEEGEFESAERLYREAMALEERHERVEGRDYALTLNNLASVRDKLGDQKEALQLYRRSVEILKRTYGPEHPWTRAVAANLSKLERGLIEEQAEGTPGKGK